MDDISDKINDLRKFLNNSEKMINDLDETIKNLSAQKILLEENEKLRQIHKENQLKISENKSKLNNFDYQMKLNHKKISEIKEENNKIKLGPIKNENEAQKKRNLDNFIKRIKEEYPHLKVFKSSEIDQLNNENFKENNINDFDDEGNMINSGNEEDEEIKNKLFNLIPNREEAEKILKKYSKEQICQLFNFDFKNDNKKEKKEIFKENNNNNKNNSIINNINDNINNNSFFNGENYIKKLQHEELFMLLKSICKEHHDDLEHANLVIENYYNFIEELFLQIFLLSEGNMAKEEMDQITINIDEIENYEFIEKQMEKITSSLSRLNNTYDILKENFGLNVEQLLSKINIYLKSLNKKKYQSDEQKQNIIIYELDVNIQELSKICDNFEQEIKMFYIENQRVLKEVNILKNKLSNEKVFKNMDNINKLFNFTNFNNNNKEDDKLAQSFIIEYKNQKNKNNIDDINEELMEKYLDEPKLIRKNWVEICYIHEDYDTHNIFYDIKAVTNDNKLIFNSCSFAFDYDKKIKIKYLTVDDIPVSHTKKLNSIEFKIKLSHSQISKIHIIYDESKDLNKLSKEEIGKRKIYREGKYGLKSILSGQKAKYSLILKCNFDIVNFSEYFLIKNKENSKTTEYYWEGIVPYNGKITNIIFSKSEAEWSFSVKSKTIFEKKFDNINCFYSYPKTYFIGGNNEIIEINTYSPQSNDIFLDEVHMNYAITYMNVEKEVEFYIKGKLKNRCKGKWLLNFTDKYIEESTPQIDKNYKIQLKKIAEEIIKEFDSNNTNKDFKFLDYMKIGLWVHKNIKYDLNYVDNDELTPLEVYYLKAGVSHHFTQLTNALLYSLGYKVIYIMGYLCQNGKEFNQDSYHSWSLIKLNNKWYPFDSTLGIFSGKLPISHIFDKYFYNKVLYVHEGMKLEKDIVSGKLIS